MRRGKGEKRRRGDRRWGKSREGEGRGGGIQGTREGKGGVSKV